MTAAKRKRQMEKAGIANPRKNSSNLAKFSNPTPSKKYDRNIQKIHISISANNVQHGPLKRFDA
jgi:hypothetical protein